jgi:hypothetical protein
MNAFSEFVQALLGLGVDAKELTSLQVSMRGIIVFVATLVMVRIGSKRSLAEKTAFDAALMIIIASVLARAINGSDSSWCSCIGCSHWGRTRLMRSAFWSKANQSSLSRTGALIAERCGSTTSPNTIWRKTCGSMRQSRIHPRSKSRGWNAAATSASSKRNSL